MKLTLLPLFLFPHLAAASLGATPPPALLTSPAGVSLHDPARNAELLADAASHTSLLANADEASTSGFIRRKFTLSDGGPNVLTIGGWLQNRYLANFRESENDDQAEDSFTHGFQTHSARLRLGGSIFDRKLTFNISAEFSGSSNQLRDAEIRYTFDNKIYVRAGQYKPPFLREELIPDTAQLAVDRSIENSVFTLARSGAAGLGWSNSSLRLAADVHDGARNLNTAFNARAEADFAVAARADIMLAGTEFSRFDDFTSFKDSTFAAMIGAALNLETYGETGATSPSPDRDELGLTLDGTLEGNGWNLFAALTYHSTDQPNVEASNDLGFLIQGGIFLTEQLELFARYDSVLPDYEGGPNDFHTLTSGINYYLSPRSHAAKITADVVFYVENGANPGGASTPISTINKLNTFEDDQALLRIQWQILF